jgi:hypothetical protein
LDSTDPSIRLCRSVKSAVSSPQISEHLPHLRAESILHLRQGEAQMRKHLQVLGMVLILAFFVNTGFSGPKALPAVAIEQGIPAQPAVPSVEPVTVLPSSTVAPVPLHDLTQPAVPIAQIRWVTIPAGTRVVIRAVDLIDSRTDRVGQTFLASVDADIVVDGQTVLPKKSAAYLRLTQAGSAGERRGKSEVRLQLQSIGAGGMSYTVKSTTIDRVGEPEVVAATTKGDQVLVRSDARLEFLLERPVEVAVAAAPPAAPALSKPDNFASPGPRRLGEQPMP